MRVLVISDIHANTPALEAVLKDAGEYDMIIHAGDIVDYNPYPREAIEAVKKLNILSVMGNHDRDVALGTPYGYNPYAAMSLRWTSRVLNDREKRFLLNLPERLDLNIGSVKVFVCHGSPRDLVDEYIFPEYPQDEMRRWLRETGARLIVLGHTHVPFIRRFKEGVVMNPGSVGQSRDGDPRASYAVLTVQDGRFEVDMRRVPYDIEKVAKDILKAGLPKFLAKRLFHGL